MNFSLKGASAIIITILALSFIIFFHEFGHYLACRTFKVPTPTFSIGFGPALVQYKPRATTFQIAILPLGGYVNIAVNEFNEKPYWQKLVITLAGIFNNLLLAALLLFIIFLLQPTSGNALFYALKSTITAMKSLLKDFGGLFTPRVKKSNAQLAEQIDLSALNNQSAHNASFFVCGWQLLAYKLACSTFCHSPSLTAAKQCKSLLKHSLEEH